MFHLGELQFISILRNMITEGYIHMDNHLANIGFVASRPVLFDFDFSQERKFTKRDSDIALAFSIYQILEDTTYLLLRDIFFWKEACRLATGIHASPPISLTATRETHGPNWDLYVGCAAYDYLLRKSLSKRYDDPAFDVVYDIRRGMPPYGRLEHKGGRR